MMLIRMFASFVFGAAAALIALVLTFVIFVQNGTGDGGPFALGFVMIGGTVAAPIVAAFARGPRSSLFRPAAAGVVLANVGAVVVVYEALAHMPIPL